MTSLFRDNDLWGPLDPAADAGYGEDKPKRKGFFTDTSICIGCKACEVACKEWNDVPADHFDMLGSSYDNSHSLNANQWRHVAFIEQPARRTAPVDLGMPGHRQDDTPAADTPAADFRWLMSSDVCKHCTHAGCLDVCPTGALVRTEFGTVVVQDDVCNGCGYCVPACPYGVIERRTAPEGAKNVGIAQKCTLCYDRLGAGETPACAKSCPTQSIQFGDIDELRERANRRVAQMHEAGIMDARLYGNDPEDGVGGAGAFFLLLDEPEVYGLPPDPVVPTRDLPQMFRRATLAAATLMAGAAISFTSRRLVPRLLSTSLGRRR
ncbi:MAG TPA: 4Fe-4S dicluster domain-containing protein [Nocardioides sp.]|nr:4Fe-4S dicluster domain-containing protein [Nocardioides sp.]